ncbi:hypothetical protein [Azospirillum argentinense]
MPAHLWGARLGGQRPQFGTVPIQNAGRRHPVRQGDAQTEKGGPEGPPFPQTSWPQTSWMT